MPEDLIYLILFISMDFVSHPTSLRLQPTHYPNLLRALSVTNQQSYILGNLTRLFVFLFYKGLKLMHPRTLYMSLRKLTHI